MPPTGPDEQDATVDHNVDNHKISSDPEVSSDAEAEANGAIATPADDEERAVTDATSESHDLNEDKAQGTTEAEPQSNKTSPQARLRLFESPPPFQPSSIKVGKEISRLNEVIGESSHEAVQATLREHWKEFLFGESDNAQNQRSTDDHVSFVLRAGITNASKEVVDAFVHSAGKHPKFTGSVLAAATPEQIEDFVPQPVLDAILKERLQTLPAMQLIRWLGEADRLGYSQDDIIDNDDESVVHPNVPSRHQSEDRDVEMTKDSQEEMTKDGQEEIAHPFPSQIVAFRQQQAKPPLGAQTPAQANSRQLQQISLMKNNPNGTTNGTKLDMLCHFCQLHFHTTSGYSYHVTKKVCQRPPPVDGFKDSCANCAQGFTTKQGLNYHNMNRVCLGDIAPATAATPSPVALSPSVQLQQEVAVSNQSRAVFPSARLPVERHDSQSNPLSRPPMYTPTQRVAPLPTPPQQHPQPFQRPPVSFTPVQTPRPGSQTPSQAGSSGGTRKQHYANSPEVRVTPNSLPAEKFAEMTQRIDETDAKFEQSVAEVRADTTMSDEAKAQRIQSLKNGCASKKSGIRKAYGVSLRLREKDKKAMKAQGLKPEYPKQDKASRSSLSGTSQQNPHHIDLGYASVRDSEVDSPAPAASYTPTSSFTPLNRPGALNSAGAAGKDEGFGVIRTHRRPSDSSAFPPNKRRRTSTPSDPSRPGSSHGNKPMHKIPVTERLGALRRVREEQSASDAAATNGKEIIEVLSSDDEPPREAGDRDGSEEDVDGVAHAVLGDVGDGATPGERRGSGMAKRGGKKS